MRYATLLVDGAPHVAAGDADGFRLARRGGGRSLSDLLPLASEARDAALEPGAPAPAGARVLAPLRPASIVAIGLNYLDPIRETGMGRPSRPLVFVKLRSSVVGPDEAVRIDTEVGDPQRLSLRCRANGATVQDSTTAEMLFGVAELVAFCSRSFTLEPGDVLLTGTPWGCGAFMDPPRFLARGDVLETEIDGVGTLHNPVVAA